MTTKQNHSGIVVQNISKIYGLNTRKPFVALDNISFEIKGGEALALLGHNGAGKTTLIKILTTLLEPTFGTATVGGLDIKQNQAVIKHLVGYTTQDLSLDPNLTVEKTLSLQSMYYGLLSNKKRIEHLLEVIDLKDNRRATVRHLSGGMKRRLMIAKALVHDPKIVILDEPTVGIDITLKEKILSAIQTLREEGRTIILTTHSFDEVERLCNNITILQNGRQVYFDTINAVRKDISPNILLIHADTTKAGKEYEESLSKLMADQAILKRETSDKASNLDFLTIPNHQENIAAALSLLSNNEAEVVRIEQPQIETSELIQELMRKYVKIHTNSGP